MSEQVNRGSEPLLLIQKPSELIRLFKGMLEEKLKDIKSVSFSPSIVASSNDSPFLNAKEVQKIFGVSRQTINDWRKCNILLSLKIKSRRYFFREQVEQLQKKWQDGYPLNKEQRAVNE